VTIAMVIHPLACRLHPALILTKIKSRRKKKK